MHWHRTLLFRVRLGCCDFQLLCARTDGLVAMASSFWGEVGREVFFPRFLCLHWSFALWRLVIYQVVAMANWILLLELMRQAAASMEIVTRTLERLIPVPQSPEMRMQIWASEVILRDEYMQDCRRCFPPQYQRLRVARTKILNWILATSWRLHLASVVGIT